MTRLGDGLNNKKTKIVRIITRLNIGGPAIHTVLLSSSFNNDEFSDLLLIGRPGNSEGEMTYLSEKLHVKPVIIPTMTRDVSMLKDLKSLFRIYAILKKEKPDIVHTHTAKAGFVGRVAAVLAGVPIRIHTFHGHVFDGYFSPVKTKVFLYIERFLGLFTNRIVVISDSIKSDIVNKLRVVPKGKCEVIKLGFDLERFLTCESLKGRFKEGISVGKDHLTVGIIGRLVPIKNHKMFLDACLKIQTKAPDINVKFIVVGDGELKNELMAYSAKIGLVNVVFTGWVKDVAEAYADLDIIALTSINEGTPVSLIEAMASAKPVVSTNVGGVSDIVSDNVTGLLVRSGNTDEFQEKLLLLLRSDELRKEFGLRGRQFVRERFAKDRLVNDIEKLYMTCLQDISKN